MIDLEQKETAFKLAMIEAAKENMRQLGVEPVVAIAGLRQIAKLLEEKVALDPGSSWYRSA